jgi:SNF2 family DNA or RNA helicase
MQTVKKLFIHTLQFKVHHLKMSTNVIDLAMQRFNNMISRAKLDTKVHQIDGVRWAVERELGGGAKGGIIADEMGLGKTIVSIGVIYANPVRRTLVVLPVALLAQWASAITRFTGLTPLVYHGSKRSRISEEDFLGAVVVVTTYDTVTIESGSDGSRLHTTRWGRIVYDEAHHLRNTKTVRWKACDALTKNIVWTITGTPLQNKVGDFYSLCRIIGFEPSEYRTTDKEALKRFTNQCILKRTKAEVGINLPELFIQDVIVGWSNAAEKQLAVDVHKDLAFSNTGLVEGSDALSEQIQYKSNEYVMLAMIRARQVCVLPKMVFGSRKAPMKQLRTVSSKIDCVARTILKRKDNGSGKLVFCHYIEEIDMIKERLLAGGIGKVNTYDGRNTGSKSAFEKADVLILQIQTGCEGLNLQEHFSEIYFVSPHWNPAVEDQAIARCYRIGQQKPVFVYRFVMDNFDEELDSDDLEGIKKTTNIENYVKQVQLFKRTTCGAVL